MTSTDWFAFLALIASVATLVFVVVNELRLRRQYRRVDFAISQVGSVDIRDPRRDQVDTYQLFEITNCGVETATRIAMTPVNYRPGVHPEFRPVRVLGPGETKRILVDPAGEIDECWVLIAYYAASDGRFMNYVWHELDSQRLLDQWMQDMEDRCSTLGARVSQRWKSLRRSVEPVGPGAAPRTRVRVHRGDSTVEGLTLASSETQEWMDRWRALVESGAA